MNKHLQYAGMALDRCDALRRDTAAIEQLWRDEKTVILPLWQGENLFGAGSVSESMPLEQIPTALMLRRADMNAATNAIIERAVHPVFLGQQSNQISTETDVAAETAGATPTTSYFAVALADADKEALCEHLSARFIDLRGIGALLPADVAALLAYARGLLFWRQQNQFCSRCGHGVTASHGGHVLVCDQAECGRETYPRTDPAVIMLVERSGPNGVQECLLGRHPNWPPGSLSTLAGFVEPGESLEEAVRREVAEESGVTVGEVNYLASQPWPFPASLMLGFIAQAEETAINIDPHELEEAGWFSREEIAGFGVWGDETSTHNLPRKDSIARFLIDHWLDGEG